MKKYLKSHPLLISTLVIIVVSSTAGFAKSIFAAAPATIIGTDISTTGNLTVSSLATSTGAFLAVNGNGQVIATTTPFLAANGNFGIGTTSPYSLLSVQATAGGIAPLFTIASSTAGAATSTALTVLGNGNVGIGTTNPLSLLSVNGTASSTALYISSLGTLAGSFLAVNPTGQVIATTTPSTSTSLSLTQISQTSYTLSSTDNGKVLLFSAGTAVTLIVPSGLGAGFNCQIVQMGAGKVTPTASGTTIFQADSYTQTRTLYSRASLIAVAADEFVLDGDLK
jgi:hypothetical protein